MKVTPIDWMEVQAKLSGRAAEALKEMLPTTNEHDGDFGPEHSSWKYWSVGRTRILAWQQVGFGPREPPLLWDGNRWLCEEDEMDEQERITLENTKKFFPGW